MNRKKMKESIGSMVQIRPPAISLDDRGAQQPRRDDLWYIERVERREVRIQNVVTRHTIDLGPEHVHGFDRTGTTDYPGHAAGVLKLRSQVVLQGNAVQLAPIPHGEGANVYVTVYQRPPGEIALPISGTRNKTAEAITWLILGVVVLAALEGWSPT